MKNKIFLFILPFLFSVSSFSQEYKIESVFYKGEGRESIFPYEGTIKITENKFIMDTNVLFLEAVIFKDVKGNSKIQYQNLEFTIEVIEESGVFDKKKYDVKIITKTKDIIGGTKCEYYCTR